MTMTVDVSTVQRIQDLLSLLEADPEVVLTQANAPIAKLVSFKPLHVPPNGRVPNLVPNIWISDDFDDQMPEQYWNSRKL
ncbi:MAG: toxin-antitoxin (TA) system antitoxin [Anaerolineaceae bacterium]|nr:toxin-antitoxin (TA) system antitoxin [Anaerolineaceae bacterium]